MGEQVSSVNLDNEEEVKVQGGNPDLRPSNLSSEDGQNNYAAYGEDE